jgi:hypothetical protein
LFYQYQSIRPAQPQPELGFVHALNNHGSYVYLTDAEATGLSFLGGMFILGFLLGAIIVPKNFTATGIEHGLHDPTTGQYIALWTAVVGYLAIIVVLGHRIVALAVSHGLVIIM